MEPNVEKKLKQHNINILSIRKEPIGGHTEFWVLNSRLEVIAVISSTH
jgi:hypothetical protein